MEEHIGKKSAGEKAVDYVKDGMIVGLGTGSTVYYFIKALAKKVESGLKVQAVSSSENSLDLARDLNISVLDDTSIGEIDLTVDGADEIDEEKQMIKGGGGALLREKVLATTSKQMIVIVDESKAVSKIGRVKLPVEVIKFAHPSIARKIENLGHKTTLRKTSQNTPYTTDNGNYIYDISLQSLLTDPKETHYKLIEIPGVVETGIFFDVASKVIIGKQNGQVEEV